MPLLFRLVSRQGTRQVSRLASLSCFLLAISPAILAQQPAADDASHPGRQLYIEACASCHGNPEVPRAHSFDTLRMMNSQTLTLALTEGIMSAQGAMLSPVAREQVIAYLARPDGTDAWIASMLCTAEQRQVDLQQTVSFAGFGVDQNNSRHLTAAAAGLNTAAMSELELAWSIGFPDTTNLRAAPVVVGDTLFTIAGDTGHILALDIHSGCAKWDYASANPIRASLSYGELGTSGLMALVFGDTRGNVQAINAETGNEIWIRDGRASNNGGRVSGSVILHEDRIIVPISDSGVGAAANPAFECCIGHGAVTVLSAVTGDKLWEYHTMPAATYTGEVNSIGTRLRGPSGAPVWATPTVDAKRGLVYIATGENTSHPATDTSDAIIALDLDTGAVKWLFQALPNDVWNMACGRRSGPNCPDQQESVLKDYDFGGPAILVERADGDVLLAGQKSGDLWALNPDDGSVLWNQRIGDGSALGGNHWGITTDGERAFLPINDPGVARPGFTPRPGMYSFFVGSGESSWDYPLRADCSDGRDARVLQCDSRFGFSATPLLIDGALVSGGLDGRLFVFDSDTGEVLFQFDTAQEFETVNGVPAKGGAIDAHAIAAGSGMIFVGSGYGSFGQTPGNVLLAFKPRARQ